MSSTDLGRERKGRPESEAKIGLTIVELKDGLGDGVGMMRKREKTSRQDRE